MARKAFFCGFILLVGAVQSLTAQTPPAAPKPSPAPSPQPKFHFNRAYTESKSKELQKAKAAYAEQCKTSKDLRQLDFLQWNTTAAAGSLQFAAEQEAWSNDHAVRDARDEREFRYRAVVRMEANKYDPHAAVDNVAEFNVREALKKADTALHDVQQAVAAKIVAAVDPDGGKASELCPEHQALRKVHEDAKRAEAQAKQHAAAAPPKKTDDCKNSGGAAGALNQLACQEGK